MRNYGLHLISSVGVSYRRSPAKPQQRAFLRLQPFDPIAAIVWLVLVPVSATVGWYGFFKALHLLASVL